MTTFYTVGPGQTYSTVAAAVAALPAGTFTDTQEIDIYWQSGGYDETGGIVLNVTPTASFPLIFRGMQAFTGAPGSQSLIYDSGNNGTFRVVSSVQYFQFINLEIDGGTAQSLLVLGLNIFTVDSCYFHNNSTTNRVLATGIGSSTYSLINSIVYGASSNRPYDSRADTSVTVDYCFFGTASSDYAVISDTESTITNTYGFGGSTNTFFTGGAPSGSNNASSDSSATTIWGFPNSQGSVSAASVITSVASDWTLKAGANSLVDAGKVTSVTVDIIGTTRPQGTKPDMGVWERIVTSTTRNRLALMGVR